MLPEEKDSAYLWDMLQAAKEIESMLEDYDLSGFLANRVLLRATERCVEILGESARRVSMTCREVHAEIPWREIIGQRNILAHEYGQIDHELLYKTVTNDIPRLIPTIEDLLPPLDETFE
ncbi:MAG: HepT-like ribonuclease domain-containing protein [Xanthomonadales bacterium]